MNYKLEWITGRFLTTKEFLESEILLMTARALDKVLKSLINFLIFQGRMSPEPPTNKGPFCPSNEFFYPLAGNFI